MCDFSHYLDHSCTDHLLSPYVVPPPSVPFLMQGLGEPSLEDQQTSQVMHILSSSHSFTHSPTIKAKPLTRPSLPRSSADGPSSPGDSSRTPHHAQNSILDTRTPPERNETQLPVRLRSTSSRAMHAMRSQARKLGSGQTSYSLSTAPTGASMVDSFARATSQGATLASPISVSRIVDEGDTVRNGASMGSIDSLQQWVVAMDGGVRLAGGPPDEVYDEVGMLPPPYRRY